jgi:hypothetical protein
MTIDRGGIKVRLDILNPLRDRYSDATCAFVVLMA